MKRKTSALLSFGIMLIIAFTILMPSCTIGSGEKSKPPITVHDSLINLARNTTARYEIITPKETVIASIITYKDSIVQDPITGVHQLTMQVLDYVCPCGKMGTIIPPYKVDTIKKLMKVHNNMG